ncbi:hypothetical protein BGW80DRAFT_1303489, partial [Lactifluus volemus]
EIDHVLIAAVMSVCAARMYRSLSQHASSTDYMPSNLSQISPTNPQHRAANVCSSIHFSRSNGNGNGNGTVTTFAASVFMRVADHDLLLANPSPRTWIAVTSITLVLERSLTPKGCLLSLYRITFKFIAT